MDLDTRTLPDGTIQVIPRQLCANGHPVRTRGTAPCLRCGTFQRFYACGDVHCQGRVTSLAHERVCPPAEPNTAGPAAE